MTYRIIQKVKLRHFKELRISDWFLSESEQNLCCKVDDETALTFGGGQNSFPDTIHVVSYAPNTNVQPVVLRKFDFLVTPILEDSHNLDNAPTTNAATK